jgi:Ca-activated chloride channel homolog
MRTAVILCICHFFFVHVCAQNAISSIRKGNEYYKLSQFDMAEKEYKQAVAKEPSNSTALYNLANALQLQKKYEEAHKVLAGLLQQSENNALRSAAHYNNGVAYTREKNLEESIASYKAALRLKPDDKQARENLQKALLEKKKKDQENKNKQQKQNQSKMSQKEAERQLKLLQEKEKKLQDRLQKSGQKGNSMPRDW